MSIKSQLELATPEERKKLLGGLLAKGTKDEFIDGLTKKEKDEAIAFHNKKPEKPAEKPVEEKEDVATPEVIDKLADDTGQSVAKVEPAPLKLTPADYESNLKKQFDAVKSSDDTKGVELFNDSAKAYQKNHPKEAKAYLQKFIAERANEPETPAAPAPATPETIANADPNEFVKPVAEPQKVEKQVEDVSGANLKGTFGDVKAKELDKEETRTPMQIQTDEVKSKTDLIKANRAFFKESLESTAEMLGSMTGKSPEEILATVLPSGNGNTTLASIITQGIIGSIGSVVTAGQEGTITETIPQMQAQSMTATNQKAQADKDRTAKMLTQLTAGIMDTDKKSGQTLQERAILAQQKHQQNLERDAAKAGYKAEQTERIFGQKVEIGKAEQQNDINMRINANINKADQAAAKYANSNTLPSQLKKGQDVVNSLGVLTGSEKSTLSRYGGNYNRAAYNDSVHAASQMPREYAAFVAKIQPQLDQYKIHVSGELNQIASTSPISKTLLEEAQKKTKKGGRRVTVTDMNKVNALISNFNSNPAYRNSLIASLNRVKSIKQQYERENGVILPASVYSSVQPVIRTKLPALILFAQKHQGEEAAGIIVDAIKERGATALSETSWFEDAKEFIKEGAGMEDLTSSFRELGNAYKDGDAKRIDSALNSYKKDLTSHLNSKETTDGDRLALNMLSTLSLDSLGSDETIYQKFDEIIGDNKTQLKRLHLSTLQSTEDAAVSNFFNAFGTKNNTVVNITGGVQ